MRDLEKFDEDEIFTMLTGYLQTEFGGHDPLEHEYCRIA